MSPLCQLYGETGAALVGQSATWDEIVSNGLLHAAAHVWIWRRKPAGIEVLVQKRAAGKMTYPGKLDISAAGHVDFDEKPLAAAVREIQEEIGLPVNAVNLELIFKHHGRQPAGPGRIENEWKFVYLYELSDDVTFQKQVNEVAALYWRPLERLKTELGAEPAADKYVYQGKGYFEALLRALGSK